jgi:hypothetical protein
MKTAGTTPLSLLCIEAGPWRPMLKDERHKRGTSNSVKDLLTLPQVMLPDSTTAAYVLLGNLARVRIFAPGRYLDHPRLYSSKQVPTMRVNAVLSSVPRRGTSK